jgi:hypothetical protein
MIYRHAVGGNPLTNDYSKAKLKVSVLKNGHSLGAFFCLKKDFFLVFWKFV